MGSPHERGTSTVPSWHTSLKTWPSGPAETGALFTGSRCQFTRQRGLREVVQASALVVELHRRIGLMTADN